MRPLVSAEEALGLDRRTAEEFRLPPLLLMENAARSLWEALVPRFEECCPPGSGRLLVALAGGGNNGGDALAVLRQARFAGFRNLAAILVSEELSEQTDVQAASLRAAGIPLERAGSKGAVALLARAGLLLDGISGTGLRGALRGQALELAQRAAATGLPVVAIDMPSGLSDRMQAGSFVLPAETTLTISPRKTALYNPAYREAAGRIRELFGVFPRDAALRIQASLLEPEDLATLAPRLPQGLHKGLRGRLGIVAGSPGMAGAAILSARAASAAGAGLVYLYLGPELYVALAGGAATGALGGTILRPEAQLAGELERLDALLLGPGWDASPERIPALETAFASELPLVLDAGALRLLPAIAARQGGRKAPLVLTPHPGEFSVLSGQSREDILADPLPFATACAEAFNAHLVLKSSVSILAGPQGRLWIWDGREPSLAVAGSGDVLAGLVAGLLSGFAARNETEDAASRALATAVIAHGCAGKEARQCLGWYEAAALCPELAKILGAIA